MAGTGRRFLPRARLPVDHAGIGGKRAQGRCRRRCGLAWPHAMSADLPDGLETFLERAGWGGAEIEPLAGDASFRRYFRVRGNGRSAMLMDAPPPHEDPVPFLEVGAWLAEQGHRAPTIHAEDRERGLVLIEDFGA